MTIDREKPKRDTVMDVTEEQIARVYAQAFMGVAAKSPNTTALVEEFGSLVDVLDAHPQLEQTLRSELVSPDEKQGLLDRVFNGRASTAVLNFLKVLSAHGRLVLIRPVARLLKKLDTKRRGLIDVEVRVAMPLDSDLQQEIEQRLRKRFGGEPVLNVRIDPSVIAGIVVRVGDQVVDASVRTHLERARRAMIERATERIETQPEKFVGGASKA